ncbi:MAG: hypothetical protein K9H49_13430 [Bacteroidales bacterium]|nr:hypothetical protein [Bacteroidales bacterium]MCF8391403.1 hypothetical protein [Bacteroidales bacterium]
MRAAIQIVLGILIIVLAYFVYESIQTPIRFIKQKDIIERATITKLMEIRDAQKAYKDVNNKYTSDFDSLIYFLKTDSFSVVKAIGTIPESFIDSLGTLKKAKEAALKMGIIKRETTKVPVMDSLFSDSYPVDSIRFVPYNKQGLEFTMVADEYTTPSKLVVQVLEVSVLYSDLLKGLDPQLVVNYADERNKITKFKGLKLGSLTEGTLTGNWE